MFVYATCVFAYTEDVSAATSVVGGPILVQGDISTVDAGGSLSGHSVG